MRSAPLSGSERKLAHTVWNGQSNYSDLMLVSPKIYQEACPFCVHGQDYYQGFADMDEADQKLEDHISTVHVE